jgi:hypothetical protein
MEFLLAVAVGVVVAIIVAVGRTASKSFKGWRAKRKAGPSSNSSDPYPVRFTVDDYEEFHPSDGYQEGSRFEVFNESDKPVTVLGFGLKLTMRHGGEWHEYEQARHHPPYEFPFRLEPNDGLDGFIHYESLMDELHERGDYQALVATTPYVDVMGFGERKIENPRDSH